MIKIKKNGGISIPNSKRNLENFNIRCCDEVIVYLSQVIDNLAFELPEFEKNICNNITNLKIIHQKQSAYKLLKHAVKEEWGIDEDFSSLKKNENGKPTTKEYCFSISHCEDLVCVAIAKYDVGVDLECVSKNRNWELLANKIVNINESISNKNSAEEIISLWTKKEAYFKMISGNIFVPNSIDTSDKMIVTIEGIEHNGKNYIMSIATKQKNDFKLI